MKYGTRNTSFFGDSFCRFKFFMRTEQSDYGTTPNSKRYRITPIEKISHSGVMMWPPFIIRVSTSDDAGGT